jgi:hypothetical protein
VPAVFEGIVCHPQFISPALRGTRFCRIELSPGESGEK